VAGRPGADRPLAPAPPAACLAAGGRQAPRPPLWRDSAGEAEGAERLLSGEPTHRPADNLSLKIPAPCCMLSPDHAVRSPRASAGGEPDGGRRGQRRALSGKRA